MGLIDGVVDGNGIRMDGISCTQWLSGPNGDK